MNFNKAEYLRTLQYNTDALMQALSTTTVYALPNNLWHAGMVCEHVILVENYFNYIYANASLHTEGLKNYGDQKLKRILIDLRTKKVEAPQITIPKGLYTSALQAQQAWRNHRQSLTEFISNSTTIIDDRAFEHPFLGLMSLSDWLYFYIHHAERHRLQIESLQQA